MTRFQAEISIVALLLAFSFAFFCSVEIVHTVAAAGQWQKKEIKKSNIRGTSSRSVPTADTYFGVCRKGGFYEDGNYGYDGVDE